MPKRHHKMKGGFLDSIGSTLSSWGNSISEGASNAWNKTKDATKNVYNSVSSPTTTTQTNAPYTGGQRKTRKLRKSFILKGGYAKNNNIGLTAAPIHNIKTTQVEWLGKGYAQPEWLAYGGNRIIAPSWIGGKSKRRRHYKSKKSGKSRKNL